MLPLLILILFLQPHPGSSQPSALPSRSTSPSLSTSTSTTASPSTQPTTSSSASPTASLTGCLPESNYTSPLSGQCSNLSSPDSYSCGLGLGYNCTLCPVGGLCPGGSRLWPRPGYWVASESSTVPVPCPEPDSLLRCPAQPSGTAAAAAAATAGGLFPCGPGYLTASPGCAECASDFYLAGDGRCSACPSIPLFEGYIRPILLLLCGLVGLAALFILLAWSIASCKGSIKGIGARAVKLIAWGWAVLQTLVSAGRAVAQPPPILAEVITGLQALQFQGLATPAVCLSIQPFLQLYITAGIVALGFAVIAGGGAWLCVKQRLLRRMRRQRKLAAQAAAARSSAGLRTLSTAAATAAATTSSAATMAELLFAESPKVDFAMGIAARLLCLLYATITNTALSTVACVTIPSTVRTYMVITTPGASNAGRAFFTALAAGAFSSILPPPLAQLLSTPSGFAALHDYSSGAAPLDARLVSASSASPAAIAALLSASFEVPVQASDPFRVCYEGSHSAAYTVGVLVVLLFSVAFPVATFGAVYHAVSLRMEKTAVAGRATKEQWLQLRQGWMPRVWAVRDFLVFQGGLLGWARRRWEGTPAPAPAAAAAAAAAATPSAVKRGGGSGEGSPSTPPQGTALSTAATAGEAAAAATAATPKPKGWLPRLPLLTTRTPVTTSTLPDAKEDSTAGGGGGGGGSSSSSRPPPPPRRPLNAQRLLDAAPERVTAHPPILACWTADEARPSCFWIRNMHQVLLLVLAIPVSFNAGASSLPPSMALLTRWVCLCVTLAAISAVSLVTYTQDPFPPLQRWKTGVSLVIYAISASVTVLGFLGAENAARAVASEALTEAGAALATALLVSLLALVVVLPCLLLWDLRNSVIQEGMLQWAQWRKSKGGGAGGKAGGSHARPWSEPFSAEAVCYAPAAGAEAAAASEEEIEAEAEAAAAAAAAHLSALEQQQAKAARVAAAAAAAEAALFRRHCQLLACALWRRSIDAELWGRMRALWLSDMPELQSSGWNAGALGAHWLGVVLGRYGALAAVEREHFEGLAEAQLRGAWELGERGGVTREEEAEAAGPWEEEARVVEEGVVEEGSEEEEEDSDAEDYAALVRDREEKLARLKAGGGVAVAAGAAGAASAAAVPVHEDSHAAATAAAVHAFFLKRRAQVEQRALAQQAAAAAAAAGERTWSSLFFPPLLEATSPLLYAGEVGGVGGSQVYSQASNPLYYMARRG